MPLRRRFHAAFLLILLVTCTRPLLGQSIELKRQLAKAMLESTCKRIQKEYYDPSMHGLDWKNLTAQAEKYIDTAQTQEQMTSAIYRLVDMLQDSHTLFIPPQYSKRPFFGFQAKAFGDDILIYKFTKDSAAEQAGLQLGDRIIAVNGFKADRQSFDRMMTFFRVLAPVAAMDIVYARGKDAPKTMHVVAKVKVDQNTLDLTNFDAFMDLVREVDAESDKEADVKWKNGSDGVSYLKIKDFETDDSWMHSDFGKIKDAKAVVLDLRGNPGGAVKTMAYAAGFFESQKTPIAEMKFA